VKSHKFYMELALLAARRAGSLGEVPIGACIVKDTRVLAIAGNRRELLKDPTAHAEILALRKAAARFGDWRLYGSRVYVTLEPCPMCAGALLLARVKEVYFGAWDPKGGALGSLTDMTTIPGLNHRLEVTGGLLADMCAEELKSFFKTLRNMRRDG